MGGEMGRARAGDMARQFGIGDTTRARSLPGWRRLRSDL